MNARAGNPNQITADVGQGPGCNEKRNANEYLFLRREQLATNQLFITSADAAAGRLNQQAFDIFLESLGHGRTVNLSQLPRAGVQNLMKCEDLLGLNQRLQSGQASQADKEEALQVLDKINLDSRMVRDVLSDEQIASIRSYMILTREQKLELLRPSDSTGTVVVAGMVLTATVVFHAVRSVQGTCGESENALIRYLPDDLFDPSHPTPRVLDFPQIITSTPKP